MTRSRFVQSRTYSEFRNRGQSRSCLGSHESSSVSRPVLEGTVPAVFIANDSVIFSKLSPTKARRCSRDPGRGSLSLSLSAVGQRPFESDPARPPGLPELLRASTVHFSNGDATNRKASGAFSTSDKTRPYPRIAARSQPRLFVLRRAGSLNFPRWLSLDYRSLSGCPNVSQKLFPRRSDHLLSCVPLFAFFSPQELVNRNAHSLEPACTNIRSEGACFSLISRCNSGRGRGR